MEDILVGPMRVAPYHKMVQLVKNGMRKKYNRSFGVMPPLDPEGVNLLSPLLVHEHINGRKVAPHIRAFAYLKLEGEANPQQYQFDLSLKDWNDLLTIDEWKAMISDA